MEIIRATIDHLNVVYDLVCELENECLDEDDFSRIFRENMNNSDVYYLLAVDESNIVGFASLHIQKLLHHCAHIGEIQEIVVSKKQQCSGIGSALFKSIKQMAVLNRCLQLEVCCNQAREKGRQFYLKQGMKETHSKFSYSLK